MARPETISSAANPLVKSVRRAIAHGSLTEEGLAVAETFHLLEEALRSDCPVKVVLAARSVESAVEAHVRRLAGIRMAVLPDALFQNLAGTVTSQGVIALVAPVSWTLEQLFRGRSLVVVLDGVQDPGNAGAIVRAAEAFGATGVMFLKGAASPFNPKTLRASAGSLFRLPFVHSLDAELARTALQQNKLDIYAGVPFRSGNHVKSLVDADLTRKCAIVIGSEGQGVSQSLHSGAIDLAVPTVGVESLNAAMAASVILYEARRQRSLKP
ncbi:MAG TPA: RNA methyltransferase [Bryobacteraceae bacterium]|nr:RNA methyltransferase [Bryobacteraceae bacterium]